MEHISGFNGLKIDHEKKIVRFSPGIIEDSIKKARLFNEKFKTFKEIYPGIKKSITALESIKQCKNKLATKGCQPLP